MLPETPRFILSGIKTLQPAPEMIELLRSAQKKSEETTSKLGSGSFFTLAIYHGRESSADTFISTSLKRLKNYIPSVVSN